MLLAVWEAAKGRHLGVPETSITGTLALLAFGLAYFQNIPLDSIQAVVATQWYSLDIFEHILSAVVFLLAIWTAASASLLTRASVNR